MHKHSLIQRLWPNTETVIVSLFILVPVIYFWFRYPFRIAVEIPFTGYSETPLPLRLIKYLLLAILIGVLLKLNWRNTKQYYSGLLFLLCIYPLLSGLLSQDVYQLKVAFFLLISFSLSTLDYKKININNIKKALGITLYLLLIYNIMIYLIYLTLERLPAHTYPLEGLLSARFGSLLEDPNSFALILVFFFLLYTRHNDPKALVLQYLIFANLLLSQSITGIIALFSGLFAYLLFAPESYPKKSQWLVALSILLAPLLFSLFDNGTLKSALQPLYQEKSESIHLHLKDIFATTNKVEHIGESGVKNLANQFGWTYTIILGSFLSTVLLRNIRDMYQQENQSPELLAASTFFILSCMVAAIGSPIENMFSISTFFAVILGLTVSRLNSLLSKTEKT